MDAIVDTATELIALQGVDCEECTGTKYDIQPQIDEGKALLQPEDEIVNYGKTELSGSWAVDSICTQLGQCTEFQKFFYIKSQTNFTEPIDGIIGLARHDNKMLLNPYQSFSDSSFLLDNLDLTTSQFSTRFSKSILSYVDFGKADEGQGFANAQKLYAEPDFFWSLPNEGIRIGEDSQNFFGYPEQDQTVNVNSIHDVYTILDTGASDIFISTLFFESFVDKLFSSVVASYRVKNGTVMATCQRSYPKIYFMLQGLLIQIPAEDYMVDDSEDQDGQVCRFKFRPIDAPFNILGMPAFLGYYVTFDWEENFVSFAAHSDSLKPNPSFSTMPSQFFATTMQINNLAGGQTWAFAIAFFISFIIFVIAVGGLYYSTFEKDDFSWSFFGILSLICMCLCTIVFFILRWILLIVLMPGNEVIDVPTGNEAVTKVRAQHVTVLGLVSLAIYKYKTQKRSPAKTQQETEEDPEIDHQAEIESFVNQLE